MQLNFFFFIIVPRAFQVGLRCSSSYANMQIFRAKRIMSKGEIVESTNIFLEDAYSKKILPMTRALIEFGISAKNKRFDKSPTWTHYITADNFRDRSFKAKMLLEL